MPGRFRNALVVIDVQNYFVNKNTAQLPHRIAETIDKSKFDFVLFTKFVNRENSNFFRKLKWKKCTAPPDTDIHKLLSRFASKKNAFEKSTYSAFKSKKFTGFLRKHRIRKIFLCGIDIDGCVLASAYDGFDSGYDIEILEDLSSSHYGKDMAGAALKIIRKNLPITEKSRNETLIKGEEQ